MDWNVSASRGDAVVNKQLATSNQRAGRGRSALMSCIRCMVMAKTMHAIALC